ncbi:hypothetical protein LTR33_001246 [Friedmanniomyces endolithicus]|nr:hypothetical protein LTR33_001246 [Friedmanniomyces endolithicus]
MDIGLQPGIPNYDQLLPRSAPAPDIRIYEPDSLPIHVPMTSSPIYENSRRRAHSNPHSQPPSLYHAVTAPETPITPTSGLLSPALASWMETDHALPKACIAQSSFEASPIRSPIRNRRGSASPSRSRSNSRHGLKAGSNKSSVSGGYECHHVGCGKQYSTIAKLNHHRRYHTPDHERPNVCDQCGARFLFKRELDRHKLSITHADRQFFCTRCNAGFGRPDHLSRHIKQDSCLDRALTPSPTSLPYSNPSTNASSVPRKLRHRVSTGHMRSGTPATDFSSLLHFDNTVFTALPTQAHALTDLDCDPFLDAALQQWEPAPALATRPDCNAQREIEEAWSSNFSALSATIVTFASLSSIVKAQNSTAGNSTLDVEPCALISALAAYNVSMFDADIAMACLRSIPVDVAGDVDEIDGLKVMVQFQSTLPYLKDPPPGYLYPAVDILASLVAIQADVQAGIYTSEYDVQMDLYNLVVSAYDFHFIWVPDLVSVFSWNRQGALVSLSSDGLSLPDVYDFRDVVALAASNSSRYQPSPITSINGVGTESWLNEFAAGAYAQTKLSDNT